MVRLRSLDLYPQFYRERSFPHGDPFQQGFFDEHDPGGIARRGLIRALEKRPISQMSIENFINEIEDESAQLAKASNEISTEAIGSMVLRRLYDLDKVAYIRFASVYRKYETADEFLKEIELLGIQEKGKIHG